MSDTELECTPPEVLETAKVLVENLLPAKSNSVYQMSYQRFLKWCEEKKVTVYSENVLLAYFSGLAKNMKSSTLWSHYSMIKSLLNLKNNIDISKYLKLRAFLKKEGKGYKAKKAKVLTKEQFNKFMFDAPDEKYLLTKIILLFGVSGACRSHELSQMKISEIEDLGSLLLIKIPETKTGKHRSFTIVGEEFINKYRQYIKLRPVDFDEQRFFLKYQNGKCCRIVIGIHKLGNAAKDVALYLNLPNFKEYTGHTLRRTSATLLVDKGGNLTTLKRHGAWRSSAVAEGYIKESVENKMDIAKKILQPNQLTTEESTTNLNVETKVATNVANINNQLGAETLTNGLFHHSIINNCTFTINFNK